MADAAAVVAGEAKSAATAVVGTGVELVDVLFDYFVPILAFAVGLVVGPAIFTGNVIGDALWTLGFQTTGGPSGSGAWSSVVGTLLGAGIVAVAAISLWRYQRGKSGFSKWLPRAVAAFLAGWSVGILALEAMAFQAGNTGSHVSGAVDQALAEALPSLVHDVGGTAATAP